MRTALAGVVLVLICAACGTSSTSPPQPKQTASFSSAGDRQCAVHYHGSGTKTSVTITSALAGKIDISTAAIGTADEQTRTLTAPGSTTITVDGNPLESLHVTVTTPTQKIDCSVTPS